MRKGSRQRGPDLTGGERAPADHELTSHDFLRQHVPGDEDRKVEDDDHLHRAHLADHVAGTAGLLHVVAIKDPQVDLSFRIPELPSTPRGGTPR